MTIKLTDSERRMLDEEKDVTQEQSIEIEKILDDMHEMLVVLS
jgi:hypothetical protein